jgi:TIR domain/GYF domain 2
VRFGRSGWGGEQNTHQTTGGLARVSEQRPALAWYVTRDGKQHGPITPVEFQVMIDRGLLKPADLVWRDGFDAWHSLGTLPEYRAQQSASAPPSIPAAMRLSEPLEIGPRGLFNQPAADRQVKPTARRGSRGARGTVFVSYRRDDSAAWAGRIYERLAQDLDKRRIFMDVDNIAPGHDFIDVLDEKVADSDIFLCVIGPNWVTASNQRGIRRLDDPNDFVRIEVESALRHGKLVVPVLVDGAPMPKADELPPNLHPLLRRNAVEVSHARFGRDMTALIEALPVAVSKTSAMPDAITSPRTTGPVTRAELLVSFSEIVLVAVFSFVLGYFLPRQRLADPLHAVILNTATMAPLVFGLLRGYRSPISNFMLSLVVTVGFYFLVEMTIRFDRGPQGNPQLLLFVIGCGGFSFVVMQWAASLRREDLALGEAPPTVGWRELTAVIFAVLVFPISDLAQSTSLSGSLPGFVFGISAGVIIGAGAILMLWRTLSRSELFLYCFGTAQVLALGLGKLNGYYGLFDLGLPIKVIHPWMDTGILLSGLISIPLTLWLTVVWSRRHAQ